MPSGRGPDIPPQLESCRRLLEKDPVLYLDLTEPLRRNEGRVDAASPAGALVTLCNYDHDGQSFGFSLLAQDPAAAERLLDLLPPQPERSSRPAPTSTSGLLDLLPPQPELVFAHEDFTAEMLRDRFGMKLSPPFYQGAYPGWEPLPMPALQAQIRPLTESHLPLFLANYGHGDGDYFRWLLDHRSLFGAFAGEVLLGFIGRHAEGSIGLLEVLPPYRRQGLARAMQTYMINRELALGHIPYGQVFLGNVPSLALQRSLGMTLSAGRAWFASRD